MFPNLNVPSGSEANREVEMVKSNLIKNQMVKVKIQTWRLCELGKIASSFCFRFSYLKRGPQSYHSISRLLWGFDELPQRRG